MFLTRSAAAWFVSGMMISGLLILPSSCEYDSIEKLYPNCDTLGITYNGFVKELVSNQCISCHDGNATVKLNTYDNLKIWVDNGKFYKSVSYSYPPTGRNMPPGEKLDACSILKLQAWVHSGAPEN